MKCKWCGKYTPEHSENGLKRCQDELLRRVDPKLGTGTAFPVLQRNGRIGEITVPDGGNQYIELNETDDGELGTPAYRTSLYSKKTLAFALDKQRECWVDIYVSESFSAQFHPDVEMTAVQQHLTKYYPWIFTYGKRRIIK